MTQVLLLHGNGGGRTRFLPLLELYQQRQAPFTLHLPALPGFDGRPWPSGAADAWEPMLKALQAVVAQQPGADWVLYGHGVGGSLLLEWASRGWALPGQLQWEPKKVVLHGIIGASLEHRLFPKMMKPRLARTIMQHLIAWPLLRPVWERRLFQSPSQIPEEVRRQFFRDYAQCAAFPIFFDLITPSWYRQVQQSLSKAYFHFIWGSHERVVAARYLKYWEEDFPNARFEVVAGWDHFPMLDEPQAFYDYLSEWITGPSYD